MDPITPRNLGPVTLTVPAPQAPAPQARPQTPPPVGTLGKDTLQLGSRRSELESEVRASEAITGKPVKFRTPEELDAYLRSVEAAKPQSQYDRAGFFKDVLGVSGVRASGREDRPTLDAVRAVPEYRPDDKILGSKLPQQFFFDLAESSPGLFMFMTKLTNPLMEAPGQIKGEWKKPFVPAQAAKPSDVAPTERYPAAFPALGAPLHFAEDFHFGSTPVDGDRPYGTYAIAESVGFSEAQAKRIAETDNGVDFNTTPYGKTSFSPLDEMDRHFNFDRGGEDTRLVWAANHLNAAIAFGRQGSYDEAEIELGAGLHSLQDIFAHGQLSPSVHATLGAFPDDVSYNPIATYEATMVTGAYLRAYLKAIATPAAPTPAADPSAAPTP